MLIVEVSAYVGTLYLLLNLAITNIYSNIYSKNMSKELYTEKYNYSSLIHVSCLVFSSPPPPPPAFLLIRYWTSYSFNFVPFCFNCPPSLFLNTAFWEISSKNSKPAIDVFMLSHLNISLLFFLVLSFPSPSPLPHSLRFCFLFHVCSIFFNFVLCIQFYFHFLPSSLKCAGFH